MLISTLLISLGFAAGASAVSLLLKTRIRQKNYYIKQAEQSKNDVIDLVEHSKDIIYYLRTVPSTEYIYLSPSVNKVLGWDIIQHYENPEEIYALIHPEDYPVLLNKINGKADYNRPLLQRWKHSEGNYIWFEETARPVYENGEFVGVQGILRNITEKVTLQKKLEYQSLHDELTGLLNRNAFKSKMNQLNNSSTLPAGLIICDMNNLKITNDTYGHHSGDQLIQSAAAYLKNHFNNRNSTLFRIGGDEFAIIMTDLSHPEFLSKCQHFESRLANQNSSQAVSLAFGSAYSKEPKGQMEDLFKSADLAMYEQKKAVKRKSTAVY
ncbi:sensor domain-containing diguanylate cyclase [Salipaludibacillus sp. CUR1]|uniref:sensor domain-containing diguanylate cyclase n=1 Tax=Salipaludibacillus sp. CUR1 TaxID=2820003 RepID=UPI001E2FA86B|nr:sensor domain-containing diguanylate cyclase [Salipaludibacillus sp. CUR1]